LAFADELAPEHLELLVREPAAALPRVQRAAAVFVGAHAPVPVGDYLAGPNHTLPTSGTARFASPLGPSDFVRRQNVIEYGARLADDLARVFRVDPAGVLVGNGSNELLQLTLLACVEPGDAVVVAAPSFSLYALQAAALGARIIEVPLRAKDGAFRFPVDELIRVARDVAAKLVLLGSPNNPTGTTLAAADAERLAQESQGLTGIDEAYRDF